MVGGQSLDLSSATWRKSRRSSAQGNNCVEVALNLPGRVAVRDSKNPGGPILALPPDSWHQFTRTLRAP